MEHRKIVFVGQGSIALEFSEYLEEFMNWVSSSEWSIAGYLSVEGEENRVQDNYPHLGFAGTHVPNSEYSYLMGCDPSKYFETLIQLKNLGANFTHFIHHEAIIARDVKIGEGVVIGPQAYIQRGSELGIFNLVEIYGVVSMFSKIGDFNYLAPKVHVGIDCMIGNKNSIGTNICIPKGRVLGNQKYIPTREPMVLE